MASRTPKTTVELEQGTIVALLKRLDSPSDRESQAMRMFQEVQEDNRRLREMLKEAETAVTTLGRKLIDAEVNNLQVLQYREGIALQKEALAARATRDKAVLDGIKLLGSKLVGNGNEAPASTPKAVDSDDRLYADLSAVLEAIDPELGAEVLQTAEGPILQALFAVVSAIPPETRAKMIGVVPQDALRRILARVKNHTSKAA